MGFSRLRIADTIVTFFWTVSMIPPWPPFVQAASVHDDANGPIIGIGLGSSDSSVAVFRNDGIKVIEIDEGCRKTSSYVSFLSDGSVLVGQAAKNQLSSNHTNTIFDIQRLMGIPWDELCVKKDLETFPFKVVERNQNPHVKVWVDGRIKFYSPEDISALILGKMKDAAQEYLGQNVTRAVVAVPASFTHAQRKATLKAGKKAGLDVVRMINEPTAACVAYGFNKPNNKEEKRVLVFNIGGGSVDASLVSVGNISYEVEATNSDTDLGSRHIDQEVMNHMAKVILEKLDRGIRRNARTNEALRLEVQRARRALSKVKKIKISVLVDRMNFSETVTRSAFEDINMRLFKSMLVPVRKTLKDAGVKAKDVDDIILVGESTQIPKVQQLIKE